MSAEFLKHFIWGWMQFLHTVYDQLISQKIFCCLSLTNYLKSKLQLPYIGVISAIVQCPLASWQNLKTSPICILRQPNSDFFWPTHYVSINTVSNTIFRTHPPSPFARDGPYALFHFVAYKTYQPYVSA